MMPLVRAEWLKLTTTRVYFGMTAGAAVLAAIIAFGVVAKGAPPWNVEAEQFLQLGGTLQTFNGLFCLLLGLRAYTEEFRHGTIAHTAFADPHHRRSSVAKAMTMAPAAALLTVAVFGLVYLTLVAMTTFSGGSFAPVGAVVPMGLGLIASGALWAVLGVGLGAIIRQPVASVVTAFLWVLGVESVAGALLGPVARYLPGQAAQVMTSDAGSTALLAAGVLTAWAAALWLAGRTFLRRRDVL